jgi:hypothetical protein
MGDDLYNDQIVDLGELQKLGNLLNKTTDGHFVPIEVRMQLQECTESAPCMKFAPPSLTNCGTIRRTSQIPPLQIQETLINIIWRVQKNHI